MKSKVVRTMIIGMIVLFLKIPLNVQAETMKQSVEISISARLNETRWIYATIDGKRYKRLYDYTKNEWVGDWIPA